VNHQVFNVIAKSYGSGKKKSITSYKKVVGETIIKVEIAGYVNWVN